MIDIYFDEKHWYLALERGHYDLHQVIKLMGRLTEEHASHITTNLLLALDYIHETELLVHRDLKPENIVFHKSDKTLPKLIDFGDAEYVKDSKEYTEFVGTPPYMSPERLKAHSGWQLKKSDVWAVGVITFEMVAADRCFHGQTQNEIFEKVTKAQWQWPDDFKPSRECNDFVKVMFVYNCLYL